MLDENGALGQVYAGNGMYLPLIPHNELRAQTAQMRAALAFDTHKLSAPDAAAYEDFKQQARAHGTPTRTWDPIRPI